MHIFFLSKSKVFDPGEVLYIYESVAGIGICVLRVIVSIVFQTILTCLVQRLKWRLIYVTVYYYYMIPRPVWTCIIILAACDIQSF